MFKFLKNLFGQYPDTAMKQALDRGAVIVDVRTVNEFREAHLEGSRNIPLSDIRLKLDQIKKWDKPVITVCRSGSRSHMAKNVLRSAGVEAYNGGAWTSLKKIVDSLIR